MLKCRDVPASIEALRDEHLEWCGRMELRLHLAMCRNCRRYVRQLDVLLGALRTRGHRED